MADPRFYDNCGPFALAEICAVAGAGLPPGLDGDAQITDLASLSGAGPDHLTFCTGTRTSVKDLALSRGGFSFVPLKSLEHAAVPRPQLLPVRDPAAAFAAAARHFYPDYLVTAWTQQTPVDPTAELGEGVVLGPGVVIGPGAEIGDRTRIGAGTVIGRGVAVGRDCHIGSNCTISHTYLGDRVVILPGARIGQPGFGFVSSASGHRNTPQLGRTIVQDDVEIGANATIDRGALGDTVIGEGTKIDNLVHIAHNCRVGRHCMLTAQVGLAGTVELGDFVIFGGQVAVADHTRIGDHVRIAGKAGLAPGEYPGGCDYGGFPARPIAQWRREVAALALLARRRKRDENG